MSQTLLRIKSLTALSVNVTVKPQDILVCVFNFRRSFSVFFHHNYLPSLVTIARWKGVPCTHGGGGAGSPFTLAPVSREFTCSHFHKKWMPRSSPTKGGLGVRESRNGHLSNIRVSDLPFLALYDAMCFNLPNHPSVSNIKQALLLESGKLCKRNCVLSSVTQLEEPGVFNRVVLCMMEQLKLCSRRIHTGYEKVQYLLDLHVGLKCLF